MVVEHPRDAVEVVRAPEERVVAQCIRTTRDHDRRTHECQPGHDAGDPELAQTTPAYSSDGEHERGIEDRELRSYEVGNEDSGRNGELPPPVGRSTASTIARGR